jgi:HSP20 family molecular chaperone IbpA
MKTNTLARIAGEMPYVFDNLLRTCNDWLDARELWNRTVSLPPVNSVGLDNKYVLTLATSGMKGNDFKIDLSENMLNSSREAEETNQEEKTYARQEYNDKSLSRSFSLSAIINLKKVCALIALVATFSTASFAQIANLNITLSDVLSFTVTQPGTLDVNFDTEEKYTNGITALASDHVSVTSSKGYIVKAIAGTVTGLASISPGTVKITSTVGASNNGNITGITYGSAVILPVTGGTPATVISAANTSWSGSNSTNKFNISYLIGSGGAYAGKPIGLNVVPVVYTVTQQ